MSKRGADGRNSIRQKENRVPNLEWLFGYGEQTSKKKESAFLRKLLLRDWKKLLVTVLLYIIQAAPVWILPLITSDVIDLATNWQPEYMTRLIIDGVVLLVLLVQNVPITMWRSSILNKWIRTLTAEIKSGVVRKLQRLSITYHKEVEEGRIQSKFLRDIMNTEAYYRAFINSFIPSLIGTAVSVGIAISRGGPLIILFFVIAVPLNVVLTKLFWARIRRQARDFRAENEKLSGKLTTALQMLPLTKSHGLLDVAEAQVDENVWSVTERGLKLDKTHAMLGSAMWMMSHLLSAICLFFCVALAIRGELTIGEVVLFQSLFSTISSAVGGVISFFPTIITGKEAVQSLSEIICSDDIERDDGHRALENVQGTLDFENLSYHYPGNEKLVVKNFNFHVRAGERIAVVGASGSGKSTLMNLIVGLLSPTQGRILIDGIPMQDIPSREYRRFISVVPQNSILFSGSLRDNITYGMPSYTEEQLNRVVEDANVAEFLPQLSNGLDSIVGEHGDKLSGGQKQRICIARALIRQPKILILDEATSSLDNVSEYHVQQAIDKLVYERTTFIVAHRLSTIRNADRIIVMDDGEMVECGTYDELMALNGKFSELERLSRIREEQVSGEVV
jgi:ATP-binding cassette subfamily B protein